MGVRLVKDQAAVAHFTNNEKVDNGVAISSKCSRTYVHSAFLSIARCSLTSHYPRDNLKLNNLL